MLHPSVHLEIARQRHAELLAQGERQRSAEPALAGRQGDRGRSLIERLVRREPSSARTARRPRRADA
jgi:hypothetical protein